LESHAFRGEKTGGTMKKKTREKEMLIARWLLGGRVCNFAAFYSPHNIFAASRVRAISELATV